jgi:8-oxo-dGTP pyrophosphatase MutT (NUDIX family)
MIDPAVARFLDRYPSESPGRGAAGAGVIAVLRPGPAGVEVLLMARAIRDGDPASGQVSLPGGHVEDRDPDLRATALRELEEEVGLSAADLERPVRHFGTFEARRFGLHVAVFAAALAAAAPAPRVDPREVSSVFWLPRGALFRRTSTRWESADGAGEAPAVVHDGHVVWGFTLRMLDGLLGADGPDGGPSPQRPAAEPPLALAGVQGDSSQAS